MTMFVITIVINGHINYHQNHGDLGSNCLIESGLHYTSSLVSLNSISSIYQKNCPSMICSDSLRSQGCLFCENNNNKEKCISCLEDHILFNGTCVECLPIEVCPFNNTDEVYCLDNNSDLSLCNESDEATKCVDHTCLYGNCGDGIVTEDEECEIGGLGCRGCRCMVGWYSNMSKDCYSECGDGNMTSDKECDYGGDGCSTDCRCSDGWETQHMISCKPYCGDKKVVGDEECDGGSGCTEQCRCGVGWYPKQGDVSCHPYCGDGHVVGDEECERGGIGCGDDCRCLKGWHSDNVTDCHSVCGDGILTSGEECEIGGEGCSDNCTCLEGWKGQEKQRCKEICGDGIIVGDEECDGTPGCSAEACLCVDKHPYNNDTKECSWCGNGILEVFEECEIGWNACSDDCLCVKGYEYDKSNQICIINGGENAKNIGLIIGVVAGVCFAFVVVAALVVFVVMKKKRTGDNENDADENERGVEMDEYDVVVENGKKVGTLVTTKVIYDNSTTMVMLGNIVGKAEVAVKCMKMWGAQLDSKQVREMDIMRKLKSEYVVMFYGTTVVQGRTGLVMEYIPMGSLESFMSKKEFSSTLKIRYAKDICLGMRYLHNNKIIHRDLKLSNILVVSDDDSWVGPVCKISDFGTSRDVDITETLSMTHSMTMTSNIGTPLYMAPELLNGSGRYSMSADVYSYGIVLAGLWNQTIPYSEVSFDDVGELLSQITMKELRPTLNGDCPQSFTNLANACWHQDPHQRPTFDDISNSVFVE